MQFARPVMGGISAPYGYSSGYLGGRVKHNGIDFYWLYRDQEGSRRVYSAHPGTVADAGYSSAAGNYVLVDIGNGRKLRYIHLDSFAVTVGQKVGYSTFIGVMGSTGTTDVHLHMDLFDGDERIDPEPHLTLPFGYTGPTLAGGTTTPILSEEDDMFSDDDRKLLQGSRPIRELVQTPDGTVWYCYERIHRYGIPAEANLRTYQAHLRALGYPDAIVQKSHTDIRAYGTPVFVDGEARIAAAVDALADPSNPASLEPVLDELRRLPAAVIAELKAAL